MPEERYDRLDGTVSDYDNYRMRPMAVIVENYPDARPQSGLSSAQVVYEALAEGGVTRFLAVFQGTTTAQQIGPVRSARSYFAEIANSWGAVFAHVGGAPDVLADIKNGHVYSKMVDMNEYWNDKYFTRVKNKPAPHNVFTSTERIADWLGSQKYQLDGEFRPFEFKDDEPAATATAVTITLPFSSAEYEGNFTYQPSTNSYLRSTAGKVHVDASTGKQIEVKNVVAMLVPVTDIAGDEKLRVSVHLTGGGRAVVFQDGRRIEATWQTTDDGDIRYFAGGGEVPFNRGEIWVSLVPQSRNAELVWK